MSRAAKAMAKGRALADRLPTRRSVTGELSRAVRLAMADAAELALVPPRAPVSAALATADTDVGPMFVRADDRFITPELVAHGTWEPAEAAFLRRVIRAGDVVLDCGANVGYFTFLASQATGPSGVVLAVEAEPTNAAILEANVWRQRATNVVVLAAATGARRSLVGLQQPEAHNSGAYEAHEHRDAGEVVVPVIPLDDILGDLQVDVVKIDVQGADHEAVAGMQLALDAVLRPHRASNRPLGPTGRPPSPPTRRSSPRAARGRGGWVNLVLGPLSGRADIFS
jgi:FkbM family methyltransferase